MNENEFWSVINQSYESSKGKQGAQLSALATSLSNLSEKELIDFHELYRDQLDKAHHWDLWAAAYIINGGCSDDGFDYFKDWLISLGQDTFEAAFNDSQILSSLATPYETDFEEFRYVVGEVFQEKFSKQIPFGEREYIGEPKGNEWDEEELPEKYPALSKWVEDSTPTYTYIDEPQELPTEKKKSIWNWFSKNFQ